METVDRDVATAHVAASLATRLEKALLGPADNPASLKDAEFPLFGIRWAREVVQKVGPRWLNRLLAFSRNSPLTISSYRSTASLLKDAMKDDLSFPPVWENWRVLSERFGLDTKSPLPNLLPVVHWRALQGWFRPFELSAPSFAEIKMRDSVLPDPPIAVDLWKAAVLVYASTSEGPGPALRGVSQEAEAIITRVRDASLQASASALDVARSAIRAPSPSDFLQLGTSARLKSFRSAHTPRDSVRVFCQAVKKINALKSIRFSPPCFSSALRCYFSFCELAAITAFAVSELDILLRRAIFKDGRTYGNYTNFVRKACFFLNEPTD